LSDEPELDELDDESEPDDPDDEDESEEDDEPVDSLLLLADPPDELAAVLLAPSRLSLR
jgi:hypothetical protein